MKSATYIIEDEKPIPNVSHLDYCFERSLPYVKIRKEGTKYWKLDFNMHPIVRNTRLIKLNYGDCLEPIYKAYAESAEIPNEKYFFHGSNYDCEMIVRKEDAEKLADQLFHLIVQLSKYDQQFFDANPVYVNEAGYTLEGFHEQNFKNDLRKKSPEELSVLFKELKRADKSKTLVLSWISDEISLKKSR
ncbi:MAG: hypothetical protein K9G41_09770 [Flavobacteriales bacterium]|nr:hypothetical protein [Flavobacteriales bacterium]